MQKFIIASFALIAGVGLGLSIAQIISIEDVPASDQMIPIITYTPDRDAFKQALLPLLQTRFGTTTVGYEPQKLMYTYPGLRPEDFNTVEANIGSYEFRDGFLWYLGDARTDINADDISDKGFLTLQNNVRDRLKEIAHVSSADLATLLKVEATTPDEPPTAPVIQSPDTPEENLEEPTMCPMDVKTCPDGSFVGRVAPGCAFAECPSGDVSKTETLCTPEQREAEACIEIYAPVCAAQQVQCVTTPCDPILTTYPNSCFACAEETVVSYTEGECSVPTIE